MPPASPLSVAAVNSSFLTATTRVNISITFHTQRSDETDNELLMRRARTLRTHASSVSRPPEPSLAPFGFPTPALWLKADALKLSAGEAVTVWPDASGACRCSRVNRHMYAYCI